mmetsp:Transcript_15227/g.14802  ORF Transcript_15227/g.14802 Transcript_15227/m.14802 type:complete len:101 (-) Transcript_15227:301-603(-)
MLEVGQDVSESFLLKEQLLHLILGHGLIIFHEHIKFDLSLVHMLQVGLDDLLQAQLIETIKITLAAFIVDVVFSHELTQLFRIHSFKVSLDISEYLLLAC